MTTLLSLAPSLPAEATPEAVAAYKAAANNFLRATGAPALTSQDDLRKWIVGALESLPEDMESIDKMLGVCLMNAENFVDREIAAGNTAEPETKYLLSVAIETFQQTTAEAAHVCAEICMCLYHMGKQLDAAGSPADTKSPLAA